MIDSEMVCSFHPKIIERLGPHELKRNPKYLKNYNSDSNINHRYMCLTRDSTVPGIYSEMLSSSPLVSHTELWSHCSSQGGMEQSRKFPTFLWEVLCFRLNRVHKMCVHRDDNFLSIEKSFFSHLSFRKKPTLLISWHSCRVYMKYLFILISNTFSFFHL